MDPVLVLVLTLSALLPYTDAVVHAIQWKATINDPYSLAKLRSI
nr:cholic acid transport protein p50 - rat (fragments) [Rattus norvegicus]